MYLSMYVCMCVYVCVNTHTLYIPQTASCYGVLTWIIGVDHCSPISESVARWPRLVGAGGPVVPWSRLAPWLGLSLA